MRWFRPRSQIVTGKREAQRIATELRQISGYKPVRVVRRVLKADKQTMTPRQTGYWVKISPK